ncbi:hypothetical protein [uncultured Vibrio sp.]|nr:hypothetical protein [uncultured Vibrio sp.]
MEAIIKLTEQDYQKIAEFFFVWTFLGVFAALIAYDGLCQLLSWLRS